MFMNNNAAFWSSSLSPEENRNRITHHNRTKRRGDRQRQEEQRSQDFWTWEEILDGKGPWAQPGEYRRPKEELEAAKAERRWYEEAARRRGWKPKSQPQKCIGGAHREYGEARYETCANFLCFPGG